MNENVLVERLERLECLILKSYLSSKDVMSLKEACEYLEISSSHLYKLTSQKRIPFYCPNGKKLYFKRAELDAWLLTNRQETMDELDEKAQTYINTKASKMLGSAIISGKL